MLWMYDMVDMVQTEHSYIESMLIEKKQLTK